MLMVSSGKETALQLNQREKFQGLGLKDTYSTVNAKGLCTISSLAECVHILLVGQGGLEGRVDLHAAMFYQQTQDL